MDRSRSAAQETRTPPQSAGRSPLAAAVCQLLDALDQAALIFDTRGTVLHETRPYRALTTREGDGLALRRAARDLAVTRTPGSAPGASQDGNRSMRPRPDIDDLAPRRAPRPLLETRTVCDRYTLRRIPVPFARTHGSTGTEIVVVTVEARPARVDDELRAMYGLTSRETMVARLIADGLPTPLIATVLGVSVHTVRRHSERIFRKLGVRTRAAVGARVLAVGAPAVAASVDRTTDRSGTGG